MVNIDGFTTQEIAERIQAISEKDKRPTRQAISHLAKKHGWQVVAKIGGANVYGRLAVDEYLAARLRTKLLREQGWLVGRTGRDGPPLIEHDDHDLVCPVCEGFAVSKPPTIEEMRGGSADSEDWPWVCAYGHSGPSESNLCDYK